MRNVLDPLLEQLTAVRAAGRPAASRPRLPHDAGEGNADPTVELSAAGVRKGMIDTVLRSHPNPVTGKPRRAACSVLETLPVKKCPPPEPAPPVQDFSRLPARQGRRIRTLDERGTGALCRHPVCRQGTAPFARAGEAGAPACGPGLRRALQAWDGSSGSEGLISLGGGGGGQDYAEDRDLSARLRILFEARPPARPRPRPHRARACAKERAHSFVCAQAPAPASFPRAPPSLRSPRPHLPCSPALSLSSLSNSLTCSSPPARPLSFRRARASKHMWSGPTALAACSRSVLPTPDGRLASRSDCISRRSRFE